MLSKEEIFHIADLAKLEIGELEAEQYSRELSGILSFVEMLDEVDVAEIKNETRVSDLENVLRNDEIENWSEEERMLALNQGELIEGLVKVKKVL